MNQVALVSGGSRGIGRGVALALAARGYDLLLNFVRDGTAAERTARDCRVAGADFGALIRTEICQADVGLTEDRRRLIEVAREKFGRLDLLVNNAGVAPLERVDVLETTEESFDRVFSINTKGPYFLTQLAARWMIELGQSGRLAGYNPKIVIISSISAYTASVERGEYCVAKAALSMVTQLFASRLAEFGINVYEIRPGLVETDMTAPVREKYQSLIDEGLTPIPRWGSPEDIGQAVRAIAEGSFPFSTGEVINVDGGFHLRRL